MTGRGPPHPLQPNTRAPCSQSMASCEQQPRLWEPQARGLWDVPEQGSSLGFDKGRGITPGQGPPSRWHLEPGCWAQLCLAPPNPHLHGRHQPRSVYRPAACESGGESSILFSRWGLRVIKELLPHWPRRMIGVHPQHGLDSGRLGVLLGKAPLCARCSPVGAVVGSHGGAGRGSPRPRCCA